jgi:hypothetical protein
MCTAWARAIASIEHCATCCGGERDEVLERWRSRSTELEHEISNRRDEIAALCETELHSLEICDDR